MIAGLCIGLILGWMIRGFYTWRVTFRDCVLVPRDWLDVDEDECEITPVDDD